MAKRLWAVLLTAFLFCAACTGARALEGLDAFLSQQYPLDLRRLLPSAQAGDPVAQRLVGLLYLEGLGVRRNAKSGISWLEKARAQGDVDATYLLGVARYHGDGVRRSLRHAFRLFESAAFKGHRAAALITARMHRAGKGVRSNDLAAAAWYLAAASEYPEALHELGELALAMKPTAPAKEFAYACFLLAHWAGDGGAEQHLVQTAAKLRPDQRARAEQLARDWQPKILPVRPPIPVLPPRFELRST